MIIRSCMITFFYTTQIRDNQSYKNCAKNPDFTVILWCVFCDLFKLFYIIIMYEIHKDYSHNRCTISTVGFVWGRWSFQGWTPCSLECQAVIIVKTAFPKAYVSVDKLVFAADGLLATSTLFFAVSSCLAPLLLLFCFCSFAFQVLGSLKKNADFVRLWPLL